MGYNQGNFYDIRPWQERNGDGREMVLIDLLMNLATRRACSRTLPAVLELPSCMPSASFSLYVVAVTEARVQIKIGDINPLSFLLLFEISRPAPGVSMLFPS
jgi:hypothetical protein